MAALAKVVLSSFASAAIAVGLTACGGSKTSSPETSASSGASSSMSSSMSSASSAAAAAEGTLASVCGEIDAIMTGNPDANPGATAKLLEAIKPRVTTPDADLIGNVAAAYAAIAADPNDTTAQGKLSTAAMALGAGCQSATGTPGG